MLTFLVLLSCKNLTIETKSSKENQTKVLLKEKEKEKDTILNKVNQFKNVLCSESKKDEDGFYNFSCEGFAISNSIIKSDDVNQVEFINIKFKDIDKAIIRCIKKTELISSQPTILKKNDVYIFLFPLVGDHNFGWLLYYYKEYKLFFLGKRICYLNTKYENGKVSYKDFTKIYQEKEILVVSMESEKIVVNDQDYKNYPNYNDGKLIELKDSYQFRFDLKNIDFYKKYNNGDFEGDYVKMINTGIIKPLK